MSIRGGQPSITTPMPPPCDSPKVVTRKSRPNVLPIACIVAQALWLWARAMLDRFEGALQIVNQITHVFDAHGQSNQSIANSQCFTLFLRHRGIRHERRMLDEAFTAAETFRQRDQLGVLEEPPRSR